MAARNRPTSQSMDSYRALVDRCARERLDYPIANGSALHARMLITKLFEIAERSVSIVTGRLTITNAEGLDVYGYPGVAEMAKKFLSNPGAKLSIFVQSGAIDTGRNNRFLKEIINDRNRNGTVTLLTPKHGLFGDWLPHFMVVDSETYRFETGRDANNKRDPKAITAIANFGDVSLAKELARFYEKMINETEPGVVEVEICEPGQLFA